MEDLDFLNCIDPLLFQQICCYMAAVTKKRLLKSGSNLHSFEPSAKRKCTDVSEKSRIQDVANQNEDVLTSILKTKGVVVHPITKIVKQLDGWIGFEDWNHLLMALQNYHFMLTVTLEVTDISARVCQAIDRDVHYKMNTHKCYCNSSHKKCTCHILPQRFQQLKRLIMLRSSKHPVVDTSQNLSVLLNFKYLTHLAVTIEETRLFDRSLPTTLENLVIVVAKMPKNFSFKHLTKLLNLQIVSNCHMPSVDFENRFPDSLVSLKMTSFLTSKEVKTLPNSIEILDIDGLRCLGSELPRNLVCLRVKNDCVIESFDRCPPHWTSFFAFSLTRKIMVERVDIGLLPQTVTDIEFGGRRYSSREMFSIFEPLPSFRQVKILRTFVQVNQLDEIHESMPFLSLLNIFCERPNSLKSVKKFQCLENLRVDFMSVDWSRVEPRLDFIPDSVRRLTLAYDETMDRCSYTQSEVRRSLQWLTLCHCLEQINIIYFEKIELTVASYSKIQLHPEQVVPIGLRSIHISYLQPSNKNYSRGADDKISLQSEKFKPNNSIAIRVLDHDFAKDLHDQKNGLDAMTTIDEKLLSKWKNGNLRFTRVARSSKLNSKSYYNQILMFDDFRVENYAPWMWEVYVGQEY